MSKFTMIILALCVSLGPIGVRAQIYTSEAEALEKIWPKAINDSTDDPNWRASLATALHRYCESILAQVPRNTPEEDRWVDDEFRDLRWDRTMPDLDSPSSSDYRFNRILNSAEHARKVLRNLFSECSSISDKLTETRKASRASEALLWVRLSRLFSTQEEPMRLAKIVGLGPKNGRCPSVTFAEIFKGRLDDHIDRNNLCSLQAMSLAITGHAVIPLLDGLEPAQR